MCNFFSAISNGEGKTLYFKIEDIAKIMAQGNPKSYEWNSHTSIAYFHKLTAVQEDKWNKWEYNVDNKILKVDQLNTKDDREQVLKAIEKYFDKKNINFIRNLYNSNSGNSNSGSRNSGNWNSGNWNSGDSNSGDSNSGNGNSGNLNSGNSNSGSRNSGNWNSGNWNSGDSNSGNGNSGSRNSGNWNSGSRNSGNWNSGSRNSGDSNSGDRNSGSRNSGNLNSGDRNSGSRNSGNWNSGNWNSGDSNSGNGNSGSRNSGNWNSGSRNSGNLNSNQPDKYRIFHKWINKDEFDKVKYPNFFWFELTQWITDDTATQEEKEKYKTQISVCGGFLKKLDYKEAWQLSYSKATQEDKDKVKQIPEFNKKIFFEITGIKVK